MSWFGARNYAMEVARGNIAGQYPINKFGRTSNADAGDPTDIWDRADTTYDQPLWVQPLAARIHDMVSTSTDDAAAGDGARTVQVYGLQTWDSKETSEILTLNGTTNVPTAESYVIIHRVKVLTFGIGGPNVGDIKFTAQSDGTVTAMVGAGNGQTLMAIYGVPSTQKIYLNSIFASVNLGAAGVDSMCILHAHADPTLTQTKGWIVKHTFGLRQSGTSSDSPVFIPPKMISGPTILKMQVESDANNMIVSGSFDGIVIDN